MTEALGMIEVIGLVSAIDTADTMAKVANISIVELKKTRGFGWMTIVIEGDVAAVQAAISSGEQYTKEKKQYISSKVIPRPAMNLKETMLKSPETKEPVKRETKQTENQKAKAAAKPRAKKQESSNTTTVKEKETTLKVEEKKPSAKAQTPKAAPKVTEVNKETPKTEK